MPESHGHAEGHGEFVRIGDQHVKLDGGQLRLGPLTVNFHHQGGSLGFDAYCCKNDFGDCELRKGDTNCANGDRPITVWKFTE